MLSRIETASIRYNGRRMKRTIHVRIFRGENQYVAECLDLPVVTEAATLDQLAANIREAIASTWRARIWPNSGLQAIPPSSPLWSWKPWLDAEAPNPLGSGSAPDLFQGFGFHATSQRGSHVKLRRVLPPGARQTLTVVLHD